MATSTTTRDLPVLPLPDGAVFPGMVVTIALESDEARSAVEAAGDDLLLVPQRNSGAFARVGVRVTVEHRGELPNGTPALMVRVAERVLLGKAVLGIASGLWMNAEPATEVLDERVPDLAQAYRTIAEQLLQTLGGRQMAGALPDGDDASALADTIAYWPDLTPDQRISLLETLDVADRLEMAITWAEHALAEVEAHKSVHDKVQRDLDSDQREALLRRQLAAIREELGEASGSDIVDEYRAKLDGLDVDEAVSDAIATEIDRLERSGDSSTEASWIRTWLDTIFDLPLGIRSEETTDLDGAREVLDRDHAGLEDVKERLVEYLAVRRRRAERGVASSRRRAGAILALVGPPGVGKTSLGASVAEALGRPFTRIALGGIHDEAEIRGHRRTYVGARPGRITRALAEAGAMNPVILLDEIDKVGADWRGDPSSALLEVLDPAQNSTFRDHYLEFDLDLSDVVFIATANQLERIPAPLLDRLEVTVLDGYTQTEKLTIARKHLLPRVMGDNGLDASELELDDTVIADVIDRWTHEAGVRELERLLHRLARKAVVRLADDGAERPVRFDPEALEDALERPRDREDLRSRTATTGVAVGLAVTGAGGDVLLVEAAEVPGEPGLTLTGQLGDVMKESGEIARSYLRANSERLGLGGDLERRIHVHFPAGATPKDGPSAGVTMTTALASVASQRPVRADVGMTGEVTLSGAVLPIGGVKQKVLAAARAGLRTVVLPARNARDLGDLPTDVTDRLDIRLVDTVDEVLGIALVDEPT